MTKRNKHKSKKLLALLFAGCMLSATLGGFAACSNSNTQDVDDSEVSVTEKDDGRISNAKFEIYDDNDGKNLIITSPKGWTRTAGSSGSNTAVSSNSASGIVDTENWETYTQTSELAHATVEEAEANWENLTVRDKLEFLFNWKKESSDNVVSDLSFYDEDDDIFNYNVDFEDLPSCKNPGVHEGAKEEDTGLLMLHNYLSKDAWGTAQKYTSSSTITLQPGLSAELSVWVKTSDLTYATTAGESQDVIKDRGAYIALTNSVSGKALDQIQVKNIVANEWTKYTFYLTSSDYAETTFTLVLGLGQSGKTKWEYVSGYAFFDDISCTVMNTKDYAFNTADKIIAVDDAIETKQIRVDTATDPLPNNTLHVDFRKANKTHAASFNSSHTQYAQTTENKNGDTHTSGITPSQYDLTGVYTKEELSAITNNAYLSAVYNKDFANYPFGGSDMLLLFSVSGSPYTAKLGSILPLQKSGEENSMVALSFWLKTSDLAGGFTGAGVKMHVADASGNITTQELFTSQNTSSPVEVEIDTVSGEKNEDAFDGWQQYFIFLKNNTEEKQTITFEFTYGPTAISTTTKDGYREGYAAFANMTAVVLEEDEFDALTESTYSKVIVIGEEKTSFTKFDDAAGVPTDAIETGFANPSNYDGVWGGSKYVAWDGEPCEKNSYDYAGLLNSEYQSNYANILPAPSNVAVADILAGATQPLVIYNDKAQSYGFIGSTQTISANSPATIGIKIKASEGAIAHVYLMESSDAGYNNTLEISTPNYVYWYDEDGNICSKDPTKSGFDKKRDVAFKRNDRGLFVANSLWRDYDETTMAGKVFANLQNYELDEEEGNLLVAKDGVEYNYDSSKWEHEGNNGIAFYGYDASAGTAYLTADKEDIVYDLASLANVKDFARYTQNKKTGELSMTVVGDSNAEWVECFFYIQTGSEAKSYRLEVWSGSREGDVAGHSAADSYVAFELISWSKDFTDLRTEKLSEAQEAFRKFLDTAGKTFEAYALAEGLIDDAEEYIEWDIVFRHWYNKEVDTIAYTAFSFFDSAKFLRYDAELDKEDVGNSYDDHNATEYKEGLAFFKYYDASKNQYSVFVDYSFVEVAVAVDSDVETEVDDEDDTTATTNDGMNIWLLISSLALAGVLLLAVASLLIQKLVRKHRKTHGRTVKVKAPKAKKEKPAKKEKEVAPEEEKSENDPYND